MTKSLLKGKTYDITMAEGTTLQIRESDGGTSNKRYIHHPASIRHIRGDIASTERMDTAA
jgi:hypothetical protein